MVVQSGPIESAKAFGGILDVVRNKRQNEAI
jgi:hypothetical protein